MVSYLRLLSVIGEITVARFHVAVNTDTNGSIVILKSTEYVYSNFPAVHNACRTYVE